MNVNCFDELLNGYIHNNLSPEELSLFLRLLRQEDYQEHCRLAIERLLFEPGTIPVSAVDKAAVFKNIISSSQEREREFQAVYRFNRKKKTTSWLLAAAFFMGLTLFMVILFHGNKYDGRVVASNKIESKSGAAQSVQFNKAVLTLADGSSILLDDYKDGTVVDQGNARVIKTNGTLNYDATGITSKRILFNTVSTPHGGQYQVELSDGSRVWLNSASSLRYPTAFTGSERRVELTGEGYFEVAQNKSKPFIVALRNANVRVLGTHFNVMAYNNEPGLATTLLEGSVDFISNGVNQILKPGQQSCLYRTGELKIYDSINVNKVLSWKNGKFDFEGEDIRSVGRQLERWYDVDFSYQVKANDLFYAQIPLQTSLKDVLKILEMTGRIHFKQDGRSVTVFN